jgi:hypothetical protein
VAGGRRQWRRPLPPDSGGPRAEAGAVEHEQGGTLEEALASSRRTGADRTPGGSLAASGRLTLARMLDGLTGSRLPGRSSLDMPRRCDAGPMDDIHVG